MAQSNISDPANGPIKHQRSSQWPNQTSAIQPMAQSIISDPANGPIKHQRSNNQWKLREILRDTWLKGLDKALVTMSYNGTLDKEVVTMG